MGAGGSKEIGVYGDLLVNANAGTAGGGFGGVAVAGNALSGNAYVRWNPNVPDVRGKNLRLSVTLKGEERTVVAYRRDEDFDGEYDNVRGTTRRQVTDYRRSSNQFLFQTLWLADLNASVKVRDAQFPFQFSLPNRLPPSMSHTLGGGSKAEIVYSVTTELVDPTRGGGWFGIGSNPYTHVTPFQVVNPQPDLERARNFPINIPPTTEAVNLLCCIPRGHMTLAAHIPMPIVASGTEMQMGFEVANNSSAQVNSVVLKVKEKVIACAEGERETRTVVIAENRIPAATIPGVQAKDSHNRQELRQAKMGTLVPSQSMKQQYISCGLPAAALESYSGRLISVSHSVELLLDTGTFVSDPTVAADVFVYRQQGAGYAPPPVTGVYQQQQQQPQQPFVAPSAPPVPPGWNPVTAPTTYQDQPSTNAATSTGGGAPTVEDLVASLEDSFDAIADTEKWVQAGGGVTFTPNDLARIMSSVKLKLAQPLVMHALMQAPGARAITCEHVVSAARASEEAARGDVARQMGPYCVDKQNALQRVKPFLSPFQWTLVSPTFQ